MEATTSSWRAPTETPTNSKIIRSEHHQRREMFMKDNHNQTPSQRHPVATIIQQAAHIKIPITVTKKADEHIFICTFRMEQ